MVNTEFTCLQVNLFILRRKLRKKDISEGKRNTSLIRRQSTEMIDVNYLTEIMRSFELRETVGIVKGTDPDQHSWKLHTTDAHLLR